VIFTDTERAYLVDQGLGRLATIGPRGTPHVQPVTFFVDTRSETIDIGGPALGDSQKFRNIETDANISFVVDDLAAPDESIGPHGQLGRGVEVRGRAELVVVEQPLLDGFSHEVIRIHPRRVITWNLDRPGLHARDIAPRPTG
jgi:pyridoxamine 5'-phosphate oxidase family protein